MVKVIEQHIPPNHKAISEENVQQAIKKYILNHKITYTIRAILSRPIKLLGDVIQLTIINPVEKTMIQNNEVEIMGFLRQELKNATIAFSYHLSQDQTDRKPSTDIEIFQTMANKNPSLLQMRDIFGLDTES